MPVTNFIASMIDDLPDLTIEFGGIWYDRGGKAYFTSIIIKNVGTAAVTSEEVLKYCVQVEKNGEILLEKTMDWSSHLPLEPGGEIAYSIRVGGDEDGPVPGFALLRAIADPDDLIPEIDDEINNVNVREWPYNRVRSFSSPAFLRLSSLFPNTFSIIKVLLRL